MHHSAQLLLLLLWLIKWWRQRKLWKKWEEVSQREREHTRAALPPLFLAFQSKNMAESTALDNPFFEPQFKDHQNPICMFAEECDSRFI